MTNLPATLDLACPYCQATGSLWVDVDYDRTVVHIECADCGARWDGGGLKLVGPDPAKPAYADATNPDIF